RLGEAYLRQGNVRKALEPMQVAVQQVPWDASIRYRLGQIYEKSGKAKEAQQEFQVAERLKHADPDSIEALRQLAASAGQKQDDRVSVLRAKIFSGNSKEPAILMSLGIVLRRAGYYQEAIEPLQLARAKQPDLFEINYNLGLSLLRAGQYPEAEACLWKAAE